MGSYRIFLTETFQLKIQGLDKRIRETITKKVNEFVIPQLSVEPHFGINIKKLKGFDPDTWRYRIGDYRIFYVIDSKNNTVGFLTIDNRKDAYKD